MSPPTTATSTSIASTIPPTAFPFDPIKAISLAAFSFAVYGDATGSRWFRTPDGTDIGFQSGRLVRRSFHSMLLIHLVRAKGLPGEKNIVEKVLSGSDPYIVTEVRSSFGNDKQVTKAIKKDKDPKFYERFFLYVEDPMTAELELTIKDSNVLQGDDVIGHCCVPLKNLLRSSDNGDISAWSGWLDVKDVEGERNGKVEVELQLVATGKGDEESDDGYDSDSDDEDGEGAVGPQSVLEGIDWNMLAAQIGGGDLHLERYRLVCFLTNEDTDTQGAIWMDRKAKEIVISFRGTQMDGWKDLLTDMMIMQEPLSDSEEDERRVHSGFRRAFRAIRQAVLQSLKFIAKDLSGWTIDATGHSLGGALACLMAHELANEYPELAKLKRLHMYSYGAPRVGNNEFCDDYDAKLKDTSFRIVNNLDLVARMPRGTKSPASIEYDHCGRTVLLSEEGPGCMSIFVEGETEGECPLRKVDQIGPFTTTPEEIENPEDAEKEKKEERFLMPTLADFQNGTSIQEMLQAASNVSNLQAMLQQPPIGAFEKKSLKADIEQLQGKASDWFEEGVASLNVTNAASTLGFDAAFIEAEMKILESIFGGKGLVHHMEPSYYEMLERAFPQAVAAGKRKREKEEERKKKEKKETMT